MTTINEADVIRIIQQNPRLVFDAMREDPQLLKEVRGRRFSRTNFWNCPDNSPRCPIRLKPWQELFPSR